MYGLFDSPLIRVVHRRPVDLALSIGEFHRDNAVVMVPLGRAVFLIVDPRNATLNHARDIVGPLFPVQASIAPIRHVGESANLVKFFLFPVFLPLQPFVVNQDLSRGMKFPDGTLLQSILEMDNRTWFAVSKIAHVRTIRGPSNRCLLNLGPAGQASYKEANRPKPLEPILECGCGCRGY